MPKEITVIIPVIAQHLQYLSRAVQSVKDSTLAELCEILVVDDSGENLPVMEKVIRTTGKTGTAHARNLGIATATTPYIFFLDADDYLVQNGLEALYQTYLTRPEACYTYGGWFEYGKGSDMKLYPTKPYERRRIVRHRIHTVNVLIAKETLLAVNGFDESYPAWEDADLFARLAVAGYCGVGVPYPIIVYDMLLGVNREAHDRYDAENNFYNQVLAKYDRYKGEQDFMPCQTCGGKQQARPLAQVPTSPPADQNGLVTLEFTGSNTAPIKFRVSDSNGQSIYYRGANDATNKFIQVPPQHAQQLLERGQWRQVVRTQKPSMIPPPQDFEAWRKKNQAQNEKARVMVEGLQAQETAVKNNA